VAVVGRETPGRPWFAHYPPGIPTELEPSAPTALEQFRRAVAAVPHSPCLVYFDRALSFADVDGLSDALAVVLAERGVGHGDRVAVMTQNVPQFVVAELAAWKLGGMVVPLNPMFKTSEVAYHLTDSGAKAIVALDDLYGDVVAAARGETGVEVAVTTSALDFLDEDDLPPMLRDVERRPAGDAESLLELVRHYEGRSPEPARSGPEDVAILAYTSGTTGRPKGAMNLHRNVVFNSDVYRTWVELGPGDVVLGAAPLFHITGLIAHIGAAVAAHIPLVLGYRFDPAATFQLIEGHRCTFTVASITAFIAMMNAPEMERHDLTSLRKVLSGGAPIAPSTVEHWETAGGSYIHNAYGLTETTSPSHLVPMGARAPVDPDTAALSAGMPVSSTDVRVVDVETGKDAGPAEVGELWTKGPQVVPGYWQRPEESEAAIVEGGWLRTGDVGKMDENGWFYIVDRMKDMINAAGYKVWPREVEDHLYEHPAVREAAVVGVPDAYRGETVKAFVALKPGAAVRPEEIIDFCRESMAAYKYPREVEIVDEIPKTATGKFLRRELRERVGR
jgi:long-chain acyl-CoA synthetase